MRPGKLDKRISIQASFNQATSGGAANPVWKDVCRPWAEILPTGGRQVEVGQRQQGESTHKITIRRQSRGIAANMRATHGDRTYHLESVNGTDPRDMYTVMMARELPKPEVPTEQPDA